MIDKKTGKELGERLRLIANEVAYLELYSRMYWEVNEIIKTNSKLLETPSHFYEWMRNSFIESTSLAVRRQLDMTKGTNSLIRALRKIERMRTDLTAEQLMRFGKDSTFAQALGISTEDAEKRFDAEFGKGQSHLNKHVIRDDIKKLEDIGERFVKLSNSQIAHSSDQPLPETEKPNGDSLEECIAVLDNLTT